LWVVLVSDSPDSGKDGSKSNVEWRLHNLPTEFASMNDVRNLLNDLKDSGRLRSSREMRLVALDGQTARVQNGGDKPQVTGFNQTTFGRSNTITYRSLGTMVEVHPHIDSKKEIQVQLDYSKSDMEKSNDVPLMETPEGKTQFADAISTHQFKTAAKLKSGTAVVVQKDSTSGSPAKTSGGQTELIILGGVVGPGGQPAN
jgi:type II secretory pathway component GspD/PulD (secretin)